ncbi:MAG: hypothetical protein A2X64_04155 [Ignavibacteria bacterium GWF2_33_9]|nr:MAG: hypothetical protein A2X64_04155 [Ignavibacteria bacterium GWF2_33_9]
MKTKLFKFIIVFSILSTFISLDLFSQYGRPFPPCYEGQMANPPCSNCSNIIDGEKIINYENCDVVVKYKIEYCDCPNPTCFVDIEFCRVDIDDCTQLMEKLHPGTTPYINNPLDVDYYYGIFEPDMYDMLVDLLFQEQKTNYLCPNKLIYKHFWPAICSRVCYAELSSSELMQSAIIYMDKRCEDEPYCCGKIYEYCTDSNGNTSLVELYINDYYECWASNPNPSEPCPYTVGQLISLDGILNPANPLWLVVSTHESSCTSPCSYPPPSQE